MADNDPIYLRRIQYSKVLPEAIFLDEGGEYSFTIEIEPDTDHIKTDEIRLSFQLSNAEAVGMRAIRSQDSKTRRVFYEVTLYELKTYHQSYPGVSLQSASLRIFINKANYDCQIDAGASVVSFSKILTIYAGCPPYQVLEAVWDPKVNEFCPNPDTGIPCSYFEDSTISSFCIKKLTF